jgi:MFS transporter, Spinster family, sphingosine-1-phosphate transporter
MHAAPSSATTENKPIPRSAWAVLVLLIFISLFNYIDRQVLSATLPKIETEPAFGLLGHPDAKFLKNLLATAFLVTYMVIAPLFGWLGDRIGRRWGLVGLAIMFWSLASGGSGLATSFTVLFLTRCLIGVGEGAYGPVGMALLSDVFPPRRRGFVIALVSAAIPVGSALGFALGTIVADSPLGWRWAFYLVVPPGLLLGAICFFMPEPRRGQAEIVEMATRRVGWWEAVALCLSIRSYVLSTAGYTAMTFVTGGIAVTVIDYVHERQGIYAVNDAALAKVEAGDALREKLKPINGQRFDGADDFKKALRGVVPEDEFGTLWGPLREASRTEDSPDLGPVGVYFGGITVIAGLLATLTGSILAERLRKRMPSSDFAVSAAGAFLGLPFLVAFLFTPFPYAWLMLFLAVFGLFLNTGPVNTILANVTPPAVRATAFALNIFFLHALGDVISPPVIGKVTGWYDWKTAFMGVVGMVAVAGALWSLGCLYLKRDTERAPTLLA